MGYDTSQTTETQLWIDNDEHLHRRKWFMFNNLAKKVKRGIFDAKKAEKLFRYLCDEAAKTYKKEIGTPLSMKDRRQAEKDLVADFLAHSQQDSFARDLAANIAPPIPNYIAMQRRMVEKKTHLHPESPMRDPSRRQARSREEWANEADYIEGVNVFHPGSNFNDDPVIFRRYVEMQARFADEDGFPDLAARMRKDRTATLRNRRMP